MWDCLIPQKAGNVSDRQKLGSQAETETRHLTTKSKTTGWPGAASREGYRSATKKDSWVGASYPASSTPFSTSPISRCCRLFPATLQDIRQEDGIDQDENETASSSLE